MKIRKRTVIHVDIEAPVEEREKVIQYLYDNQIHFGTSGPKRISVTKVDPSIFEVWDGQIELYDEKEEEIKL